MKGANIPFGSRIAYTAGTAGGDAVIVLPTATGEQSVIDWVTCSQDAASNTGTFLTIAAGTSTIFKTLVRCVSTGPGAVSIDLSPGIECGVTTTAITITRSAIAATTMELAVGYR